MFSVLKNIWNSLDWKREQQNAEKEFEKEQKYLEDAIEKENEKIEKNLLETNKSSIFDAKQQKEEDKNIAQEQGKCFKATGKISSLSNSNGTINNYIFFDFEDAKMIFNDLKVGNHVEFIAYQNPNSELTKIVKITQILDEHWDQELEKEQNLENEIEKLKNENPIYFHTHARTILGLIIERQPETITIETENAQKIVSLDSIETNFIPYEGDRIYVQANVRYDEDYVDKMGEILEITKIEPARLLKHERCVVKCVHDNWGELNDDIYYLNESLLTKVDLNEGDIVDANLIECARGKFNFRCIHLMVIESNYGIKKSTKSEKQKNIATVDEDKWVVYHETFLTDTIIFTITNNREHNLNIKNINIFNYNRESQIKLIDPPIGKSFIIESLGKKDIKFEVTTTKYGDFREYFIITFNGFKIKRSIRISVCENQKDAELLKKRIDCNEYSITEISNTRQGYQRSRHYANQVWSNKNNIYQTIPGVGLAPRRRFVHFRISQYDVPKNLRIDYLTSDRKTQMAENIYGSYPFLKEELNFVNYSRRFQILIFLEEIQHFITFRNYDRERGHFERDGEYLTLMIEDLAERRPSLVLGDSLRCINPWETDNKNNQCYEGFIHKTGRDRIYVKFNAAFHKQYNGEDYRIEFYFSRFNYRKQHHAVNFVSKTMGETFLFPNKLHLNENFQLDVDLNEDNNLIMKKNGKILKWFNPSLNIIQKYAIKNILRGEAKNMPYIIFGPPGTGKTITIVEAILQLLHNISGSRLIVATPSNSSADLISTRLINSGSLKVGEFMRLVSQNQIEREAIPEHLKPYCGTIDVAIDGSCKDTMVVTSSGVKLRCQMKFLGRHRITISTCSTIGGYIQLGFPEKHFTHVLIDESGQCSEPEMLIPLSLISPKRSQVIIAGDPQQLPAIVCNNFAKENGLSISFLERIIKCIPYRKDKLRFPKSCGYDPRLVTKLLYNYRALPSIMNIYSHLFYDAELLPMISDKDSNESKSLQNFQIIHDLFKSNKRSKTHGAFFNGIISNNQQENDSPSWFNPVEAKNIFITVIQFYRHELLPENIGIITPYIKQVKHLRNLFNNSDIKMPKIGTVEEFQGQERDVILISTVRSSSKHMDIDLRYSLGFVKCPRRMNVAISRARYLLVVFGNPHFLVFDSSWRAYIKYCIDNDAYAGCELPEDIINELHENDMDDEVEEVEKMDEDKENYILKKSINNKNIKIEEEEEEQVEKCEKLMNKDQQEKIQEKNEKTFEKSINKYQKEEEEEKLTKLMNKNQIEEIEKFEKLMNKDQQEKIQEKKEKTLEKSINKYQKEKEKEEEEEKLIKLLIKYQEDKTKKLKSPTNKIKEINEIIKTPTNESKEKEFLIKTPMGVLKTRSPLQKEDQSKVLIEKKQEESDSDISINNDLQCKSKENKKYNERKRRSSYRDEGQERFNYIMENGYTSDLEEQWF